MNHIAPKNFKRGRLIANKYRLIDLIIAFLLISTSVITVLTYVLNNGTNLVVILIMLIPCLFAALILIPLDFYHNIIQRIFLWFLYLTSKKQWKWQGTYHYISPDKGEENERT